MNNNKPKTVFYEDECDKYDYLISAGCGAISGLVDIFLVGSPIDSKLQYFTDTQVDKSIMVFSKTCGWSPRQGNENNVSSAISHLENKFKVNYDQRHSGDIDDLFRMSTRNHHMKSLAHSPSIVGLFFSILNQFTSTASFLDNGKLTTVNTETFELQGHDLVSRLFCGIANWFGHIMSDIGGSSGASSRGSGVVIPFYELFQLCDFGSFKVGEHRNTIATIATKVFERGYDARYGLTMGIPVVLCDLSVRLIWGIKHFFYHRKPINECIPTKKHNDLRIMLIVGYTTLCTMDGIDAKLRSGGNTINFFLRLNIIAWYRFVFIVIREICIRNGISYPLQRELDAYIRINEALSQHLEELEKIDIERFKKETQYYNQLLSKIERANSEKELTNLLEEEYKTLGIQLPYKGDFDEFMQDDSLRLEFK